MTVVSLLAGVYVIARSLREYLDYDVFTQTKRLYPGSSLLPAVTFCTDASATASSNLSDLFVEALFMKQDSSNVSLEAEQFRPGIHQDEPYRCIRFNQHTSTGTGTGTGNRQELFYATHPSELFFFNITLNASFTFIDAYLSDNYVQVLSTTDFVSGFRHASSEIYIELTKSLEIKLEEPYNECAAMADHTYRQANCLVQCQEERAVSKYNCTLETDFWEPGLPSCDEDLVDLSEFVVACSGIQCPKECEETKYDSVVSSYDNPYLSVQVAFLDLSYIEISQIPKMTGVSLLSNIGGALGLFIGVRFLSLLELFEYLAEVGCVFYRRHGLDT